MRIHKRIQGEDIEIEFIKIKDYPNYTLYQICKKQNGKLIPMYRECYNDLQIREIAKNRNVIMEEVFR